VGNGEGVDAPPQEPYPALDPLFNLTILTERPSNSVLPPVENPGRAPVGFRLKLI